MNVTDIYRKAIKRLFANLYGVPPDEVDVSWADDTITVRFADKTFTHDTISDDDDAALEFVGDDEDPVTVSLTEDETRQVEQAAPLSPRLNGF
jgi:hypothetical protein